MVIFQDKDKTWITLPDQTIRHPGENIADFSQTPFYLDVNVKATRVCESHGLTQSFSGWWGDNTLSAKNAYSYYSILWAWFAG